MFRSISRLNRLPKGHLNRSFIRSISVNSFTKPSNVRFVLTSIASISLASIYLYNQSTSNPLHLDVNVPLQLTPEEVSQHNTRDDLWIALNGNVYNLTTFLTHHPGGQKILLKYAGKDASKLFNQLHPPDALTKFLAPEDHLGPLIGEFEEVEEELTPEELERLQKIERKPPLSQIINLHDFETVAFQTLPPGALAYYSSAADDEITLRENHNAYHRIFFNPKILVDVSKVDITTKFFNDESSAPFYITATALAKLGHPDGEVSIAKGAGREHIHQMISTLASCSFDEIVDAKIEGQNQWYQLYVNSDRALTERAIKHAEERGIKGLFITVDAPCLGRREKDMKMKFEDDAAVQSDEDEGKVNRSQGAARAISSFIDPSLNWNDIKHIRTLTKMPIVLKGVQRKEDVFKAIEYGVQGVVLSNHGGRQLDFTRAPVEVLAEVMPLLREQGLDKKIEIYIDGGIRRGTDILKALCLGAKGVGLGRPFLYANSTYGEQGVVKAIQLLKDELEMNMSLLGVTKIEELGPELLDTRSIFHRSVSVPKDHIYRENYLPMEGVEFRAE